MFRFKKNKAGQAGKGAGQCFISHCSDDGVLVRGLQEVLSVCYGKYDFFNTLLERDNALAEEEHSTVVQSSMAGDDRSTMIRSALNKSDVMIAVLTDSYIRSPICISEISSFWYTQKKLIPIVFSAHARDFLRSLLGADIIYIDAIGMEQQLQENVDAARMTCADRARKFVATMESFGYHTNDSADAEKRFADLILKNFQAKATRPYIGSEDVYTNILEYCFEYGVSRIGNTSLNFDVLKQKLTGYTDLYFLCTTGRSMIHTLSSDFFPRALMQGVNITVLLPNRFSEFIEDVAEVESPLHKENNSIRLADEFNGVMNSLDRCLEIPEIAQNPNRGRVFVGCCYTLLRQTVTMAVKDDRVWGWLSITMPPKKTAEGTPSFEFSGSVKEPSMAKVTYEHLMAIRNVARARGDYFEITPDTAQLEAFHLEKKSALNEWQELYRKAKINTLEKHGDTELIEIAAQHPLNEDGTPGEEFQARLDYGYQLYQQMQTEGKRVKIYIPGSLHMLDGIPDSKSLSRSGKDYLLEKGVPEEDIYGPETNEKYKNEQGVYNSADECYVAAAIYLSGNYNRLHCVCSSNQMTKKKLFYLAFGVIAVFHTVDIDRMFHDDIKELLQTVPGVIYGDHTWQNPESEPFINSRATRRPKTGEIN